MSASPANSRALHGFPSLTRGVQVSAMTDVDPKLETKSERTASPSAETVAASNRTVASRSSRQPRLSYSLFAPSSDNDYPRRLKSDATEEILPRKEDAPVSVKEGEEAEEEEEEEVKRTWNLRPRKGCGGSKKGNGVISAEACGGGASEVKNQKSGGGIEPKSNRQRGIPAESPGLGGVEVANENHRLWVALSRDEIEEDVFSMSGSRPSRRPRKRTKTLQKHLDVISPGLCLVGMNADCFRVSNSPSKSSFSFDISKMLLLLSAVISINDKEPLTAIAFQFAAMIGLTKEYFGEEEKRVDRYAGGMVYYTTVKDRKKKYLI
ncbi:unnamed protein product [Thlaspi arvense]|uniref:Uncharacterized protein n=1 Tax=Thlaspi arvense TaxID=13288 RepID=A0AAU9T434_THLAR|nr:unnamed protein product [Thlaspi arvense]